MATARKVKFSAAQASDSQLAATFKSAAPSADAEERGRSKTSLVPVESLSFDPEFQGLFDFDEEREAQLAEKMEREGFDPAQPVHLAKILEEPDTVEKPIVIDGHHRAAAAEKARIQKIPAYVHTFETRKQALTYALELQILRRNLTDGQKAKAVARLDELKGPGKKAGGAQATGRSDEETAKKVGMSARNVSKVRNVLANADEETKEALLNDKISINQADKITNEKKKASKPAPAKKETPAEDQEGETDWDEMGPPPRIVREFSAKEGEGAFAAQDARFCEGFRQGFGAAADAVFDKVVEMARAGKSAKDVEADEIFSDLSFDALAGKLGVPIDGTEIAKKYGGEK
ncbi:MAG: ParB N-terminal domain-containing protein [Treponema sp.]|nr:ParB N-terminal domain-containing protein [Treponema sp.]